MKRIIASIVQVIFLCLLLSPVLPVQADIAPPSPPSGSNILPGETTQVRMMAETVNIDIQWSGDVLVDANFTMRNLSTIEERMDVYFPLNFSPNRHLPKDATDTCFTVPDWPTPIAGISAWVNGASKPVTTKYNEDYNRVDSPVIPCWAYFPVTFPPGKDVNVRVQYKTQETFYILQTGAGWNGTIGRADIIVRFPYEINEINFLGCYYQMANSYGSACQINGKELHWYAENFEPDFDFEFDMAPVDWWYNVLSATAQTQKNPNDAEAWGKLGLAYKTLIKIEDYKHAETDEQGNQVPIVWLDLYSDRSEKIFKRSAEAYQKAVSLKPSDADWHYGYAELLCYRLMDGNYKGDFQQDAALCAQQLKLTFENKPGTHNKDALRLLQQSAALQGQSIIDLSGPQPDYLILTPQPATETPTLPSTLTSAPPTLTATPAPTQTLTASPSPAPTNTSPSFTLSASITPEVLGKQVTSQEKGNSGWLLGVAIIAIVAGLGIATWMIWQKKKG